MHNTPELFNVFEELRTAQICLDKEKIEVRHSLIDYECNTHFEFNGHPTIYQYKRHLDKLYEQFKKEIHHQFNEGDSHQNRELVFSINLTIDELGEHLNYHRIEDALADVEVKCGAKQQINDQKLQAVKSKTRMFLKAQVACFRKIQTCLKRYEKDFLNTSSKPRKKKARPGEQELNLSIDQPLINHSFGKFQVVELIVALHSTGMVKGDRNDLFRKLEGVFGMDLSNGDNTLNKLKDRKNDQAPFIHLLESSFLKAAQKGI